MGQNQSTKSEEPSKPNIPSSIKPQTLYVMSIEDEKGCNNIPLYMSFDPVRAKKMYDKTLPAQWSRDSDGIRKYLIETSTEKVLENGLLGEKKLEESDEQLGGASEIKIPKKTTFVFVVAIEDKKGCKDMPIFISQDYKKAQKIYGLIKPDQYVTNGNRKYIAEVPLNKIIKQGFFCENILVSDPKITGQTCEKF